MSKAAERESNLPASSGIGALMVGSWTGSWLARTLHRDPIHHLQRHWGKKLTVFTTSTGSQLGH